MAKQPKTYTAPHAVYTGGKLYNPGERFTTYDRPGKEWNDLSRVGKGAVDTPRSRTPPDMDHEAMTLAAVQAVAATQRVNPKGLSKAEVIAAIRAVNQLAP
jgi:hypothetical protein